MTPVIEFILKPVPTTIPPKVDVLALLTSMTPVIEFILKPVPTITAPRADELALGKSDATIALKLGAPAEDPVAGPAKM